MKFDHIAWRTERANIHDPNRPVEVEAFSEMPGTLTIIGRGPSKKQAVFQVVQEATRRGLPLEQLPNPAEYSGMRDRLDTWLAATWTEQ